MQAGLCFGHFTDAVSLGGLSTLCMRTIFIAVCISFWGWSIPLRVLACCVPSFSVFSLASFIFYLSLNSYLGYLRLNFASPLSPPRREDTLSHLRLHRTRTPLVAEISMIKRRASPLRGTLVGSHCCQKAASSPHTPHAQRLHAPSKARIVVLHARARGASHAASPRMLPVSPLASFSLCTHTGAVPSHPTTFYLSSLNMVSLRAWQAMRYSFVTTCP